MSGDSTSNRPPLTFLTNVFYGIGSIAFGVHETFASGLMLFFNQVVGLPVQWVGATMMVTLVFDAICDPLIGEWSDHTRSRWGRRHPFMYASAVPAALAFYFLFSPPLGWSKFHLVIYMGAVLMTMRVLLSLYEVPSSALGPELTMDYDQRTSLMSSRFFFGTIGGAGMAILALQVFLRKDATHPLGLLNRAGYSELAVTGAVAIFLSIMISCLGTHRFIAAIVHQPVVRGTWREKFVEVRGTLANRSFLALTVAGIFGAVSNGLKQGLDFYMSAYFWELTPAQMSYLAAAALFASFAGIPLAQTIPRRFDKKHSMLGVLCAAVLTGVVPITMRLLGLGPANGTRPLLALVIGFSFISTALATGGLIIASSMMADVVEDAAVTTGRRSEGLLFAAQGLIRKSVIGLGTFFSGLILAWVGFPEHGTPGQVDPAMLHRLGLVFVPLVVTFAAVSLAILTRYDIDRSRHMTNVGRLESEQTDRFLKKAAG